MGLSEIVHVRCLIWCMAQSKQQGMEAKSLIKKNSENHLLIHLCPPKVLIEINICILTTSSDLKGLWLKFLGEATQIKLRL